MGRTITSAVLAAEGCRLGGASQYPGHPAVGQDAGALAGAAPAGIPVSGRDDG
jgi:4-hydroxy-tetrahydrodipicolinate reductase